MKAHHRQRQLCPHPLRACASGFTLVELLVVITTFGAIMAFVGITFAMLARSEKLAMISATLERTTSRLAAQFRDDVHQSLDGECIPGDDTTANQLSLSDATGSRLRYRVTKEGVARLVMDHDTIVAREDFRLPGCRVQIFRGDGPDSIDRILAIERPSTTVTPSPHAPAPRRMLKIQASLNQQPPSIRRPLEIAASETTPTSPETAEESK